MDDKDIERILKDSANKTELMPSEERWNRIKDRLDMQVKVEEPVLQEVTVAASAGNANKNLFNSARGRVTFGFIVFCVCLILCLAIVLPIYFSRPGEHRYMDEEDLIYTICSDDEFFEAIKQNKFQVVNFTSYKLTDVHLLKTEESIVLGGGFSSETDGAIFSLTFLSNSVLIKDDDYMNYKEYTVSDTNIQYISLNDEDGTVSYKALAKRKGVTYKIEYTAVEDNVFAFFDEFFK